MSSFSIIVINRNSNVAVVIINFYINQLPAFSLSALRSTLKNILHITVILFYFFSNNIFSYKTLTTLFNRVGPNAGLIWPFNFSMGVTSFHALDSPIQTFY